MERRFHNLWLYILTILAIVGLYLWSCSGPVVSAPTDVPGDHFFHTGWSQVLDGKSIPLQDIHDYQPVPVGQPLTFTCILPSVEPNEVILFYSDDVEVQCFVEDTLVQDFTMQENLSILKTPGSAWNQVDLMPEMSGKPFTMTLTSWTEPYWALLPNIYFTENIFVNSIRVDQLSFRAFTAGLLLFLSVLFFVTGFFWINPRRKWFFLSLAQLYLYICLWLLAELNVPDIFFQQPVFSYLLSSLFLGLIPIGLWQLTVNSIHFKAHPFFVRSIGILTIANLFLPWILQFTLGISLLESRWLHMHIVAVLLTGIIVIVIKKTLYAKDLHEDDFPCPPLLILFIGGLTDMVIWIFHPVHTPFTGVGMVAGCCIYTVTTFILFLRYDARIAIERLHLQSTNEKLQTTSLMEQIKAHFIFNTLNGISALCKENPAEADRATRLFATYLRSYMYLTNQQEPIPVAKELTLVQAYLAIEQIRFGDSLQFQVNDTFLDFNVPPLSIQPLVENAMIHGIRSKVGAGRIRITMAKVGNTAQVTVEDDGAGFVGPLPRNDSSVGLTNVEKRLQVMCGGTLKVASQVTVGTRATITVPLTPKSEPPAMPRKKQKRARSSSV